MTKTYLLGAGASVGYTESEPLALRPPRSKDFFLRGRDFGILEPDVFPELHSKLCDYLGASDSLHKLSKNEIQKDIEEFLTSLIGPNGETNTAFGECIFFVYELLRHYQKLYTKFENNYHRLANHWHREKYRVISLNYDALFEQAVQDNGLGFSYGQTPERFQTVDMVKPHGSITMSINYRDFGPSDDMSISNIAKYMYGTTVHNVDKINFQGLSPGQVEDISIQDFSRYPFDYSVPAIIPPVGGEKNYNQFDVYQRHHEQMIDYIDSADELVIIGCSLRSEDDLLINMLEEWLSEDIYVKIVARSSNEEVADTIQNIREDAEIDTSHSEFTEYARTL